MNQGMDQSIENQLIQNFQNMFSQQTEEERRELVKKLSTQQLVEALKQSQEACLAALSLMQTPSNTVPEIFKLIYMIKYFQDKQLAPQESKPRMNEQEPNQEGTMEYVMNQQEEQMELPDNLMQMLLSQIKQFENKHEN